MKNNTKEIFVSVTIDGGKAYLEHGEAFEDYDSKNDEFRGVFAVAGKGDDIQVTPINVSGNVFESNSLTLIRQAKIIGIVFDKTENFITDLREIIKNWKENDKDEGVDGDAIDEVLTKCGDNEDYVDSANALGKAIMDSDGEMLTDNDWLEFISSFIYDKDKEFTKKTLVDCFKKSGSKFEHLMEMNFFKESTQSKSTSRNKSIRL